MQERLEGSYPRRLTKRSHNRNPTYHSFHINDILGQEPSSLVPQSHSNSTRSKQETLSKCLLPGKSQSTNRLEFDSLYRAEEEYASRRLRNPEHLTRGVEKEPVRAADLSSWRPQSSSLLQSALNCLNFKSGSQIRSKQVVGYDIITNQGI